MAITENAKAYHDKMFPGYVSDFLSTDPEFIESLCNYIRTFMCSNSGIVFRQQRGQFLYCGNYRRDYFGN